MFIPSAMFIPEQINKTLVIIAFFVQIEYGIHDARDTVDVIGLFFSSILKCIKDLVFINQAGTKRRTDVDATYRIFPAIRRGFRPSRMTSNNLISPMKFCYNTNSTLPKQCQSSRSVLQDGSRTFGLFWKEKTPSYNRRNTVITF